MAYSAPDEVEPIGGLVLVGGAAVAMVLLVVFYLYAAKKLCSSGAALISGLSVCCENVAGSTEEEATPIDNKVKVKRDLGE